MMSKHSGVPSAGEGRAPVHDTDTFSLSDEPPSSSRRRRFWNPEVGFAALADQVMPALFEQKAPGVPLRAWVPGCSTGEDAYSIAILLADHADRQELGHDIEIFGTDLEAAALQLARRGSYSISAVSAVPPALRERYFSRDGERYRINRRVRNSVVFAAHDLFSEPPLSNMDLVVCHGLTVGRSPELAEIVFPALARSLVAGGFLVLGPSEHVSPPRSLFVSVPGLKRTYRRQPPATTGRVIPFRPGPSEYPARPTLRAPSKPPPAPGARGEALLLQKYSPPSVIVDEAGEVLRFIGNTGAFLEPPPGEPTNNLMRLVRLEVRDALRRAFHHAVLHRQPEATADVDFDAAEPGRRVRILVTPIVPSDGTPSEFVIAFEEQGRQLGTLDMMQAELKRLHEDLARSTEEFQFINEELRSANEELVCNNYELRAAFEELDCVAESLRTAHEDGESLLREVKGELEGARAAAKRTRARFERLTTPTLILDGDLNIEDFTLASSPFFRVLEADRGRPVSDLRHGLRYDGLVADTEEVMRTGDVKRFSAQATGGSWHVVQIAPRIPPADGVEITVHELEPLRALGVDPGWVNLQERPSSVPPAPASSEDGAPLSSALGNFAAEIAHEIKDPLNTITVSTELALRNRDVGKLDAHLHTIGDAARRCGRIIESVLGLVRHEPSKKWPNDVHVVVRHAAALLDSYLIAGLLSVEWKLAPGEVLCACNPTELEQVFVNLLKNAVQAQSPSACKVTISSTVDGERVSLVVEDDGPGMPADVAGKVFDRLYSTRRGSGGTGLGLALAREIVGGHGGTIQVLPRPAGARGTAIEISLPTVRANGRASS